MNYLLVENRQSGNPSILLGPIVWKPRFIQSEIDDLEVDYKVPPAEQGYIKINDNLEIIPVIEATDAGEDPLYEGLAGPFYNYTDTTDTFHYNITGFHPYIRIGFVSNAGIVTNVLAR